MRSKDLDMKNLKEKYLAWEMANENEWFLLLEKFESAWQVIVKYFHLGLFLGNRIIKNVVFLVALVIRAFFVVPSLERQIAPELISEEINAVVPNEWRNL